MATARQSKQSTSAKLSHAANDGSDPAVRVLRNFRQVFNAVKSHFQQVEKKAGLGGAQLWALSVIQSDPGIGVNGLAATMDIHQTTASNLVKSLVSLEMVRIEKKGVDRRTVQLYVQPDGVRVLEKAPGPFAGVLPNALAQLDEMTLLRIEQDLQTILQLLDADDKAARIPLAQM
ncbi:MAG: MarR family winged helix-turn-helix transcriptional regulator [Hylemonella sp.]